TPLTAPGRTWRTPGKGSSLIRIVSRFFNPAMGREDTMGRMTLGPGSVRQRTEVPMAEARHASGAVEVKVTPVDGGDQSSASARLSLVKTFDGDLAGASRGDMWTADTSVKGSGGYVAIEKFEGKLLGRNGAFTLIHQGTMDRGGNPDLRIVVVPGSGSGELE